MPVEVIMPKVDMDMDAGRVLEWHAAEGETVRQGETLFDIETDKATMEVESPANGILRHVIAPPGTEVPIGSPVAWLYAEGEVWDATPPRERVQARPTSPASIAPEGAPTSTTAPPWERLQARLDGAQGAPPSRPRATPAARRRARELGVALAVVSGTGPNGRIVRSDVEAADAAAAPGAGAIAAALGIDVERVTEGGAELSVDALRKWLNKQLCRLDSYERGLLAPGPARAVDFSRFGETLRVPLDEDARQRAGSSGRGWREVPQVTHHDEAVLTTPSADGGASDPAHALAADGLLAHLLAVLGTTLEAHPLLAATLDSEGGVLVLKRYSHVALCREHNGALREQIVRDVSLDARDVAARLAGEVTPHSPAARDAATIDVLWLGDIAGLAMTPLVRAPCVAALAAGRLRSVGHWDGAHFVRRDVLPLSLSYDHRAVDGAEAARFMRALCDRLAAVPVAFGSVPVAEPA